MIGSNNNKVAIFISPSSKTFFYFLINGLFFHLFIF